MTAGPGRLAQPAGRATLRSTLSHILPGGPCLRRLRRIPTLVLALCLGAGSVSAQSGNRQETIVIVTGQAAAAPIPTLIGSRADQEVADLLFLPLARLGTTLITAGDKDFEPQLARSWSRRDSLTLVFELDPRARWHDGVPVTARDVLLALSLGRDPAVDPQRALLLRRIADVRAEGEHRVVVRFTEAYNEQLYDAVFHIAPLPAHLVDTIPRGALASSAFAQAPVGNGPYRWSRREVGQRLELVANETFFLGRPKIQRVVFLTVRDPDAQVNLFLSGTADVLSMVSLAALPRVQAAADARVFAVPTFNVGYLLFNQRDPADRTRPHPLLADPDVRRAIALTLDRVTLVRATFGDYASVAEGPVGQLHWIRDPSLHTAAPDPAGARELLRSRGWRDSDGDGILDRDGRPLRLRLNYPATSATRGQMALQVQEQLRQVGIGIELNRLDAPVWMSRRNQGDFDIDFASASLDPSPSGLVQSWSCEGRSGSNVAQYCNPLVDSLLGAAQSRRVNALQTYRAAVHTIVADIPAIFLFAPVNPVAIHGRFNNVALRPDSPWASLWRWTIRPTP